MNRLSKVESTDPHIDDPVDTRTDYVVEKSDVDDSPMAERDGLATPTYADFHQRQLLGEFEHQINQHSKGDGSSQDSKYHPGCLGYPIVKAVGLPIDLPN